MATIQSNYTFDATETCQRNDPWTGFGGTNITIVTPPAYNSTWANITVLTLNATINATTIVDATGANNVDHNATAQGFVVSAPSYLYGLSLYVVGAQKNQGFTMAILQPDSSGLPNTSLVVSSFSPVFSSPGGYWANISFSPAISLAIGHYFLYMPPIGGASKVSWAYRSPSQSPDAYYINSTSGAWNVSSSHDFTLQISLRAVLNPGDPSVQMAVDNQPVLDLGNGYGWVNLTKAITGTNVTCIITNSTPIFESFAVNSTFVRNTVSSSSMTCPEGGPAWNLPMALTYPGLPYGNYAANLEFPR